MAGVQLWAWDKANEAWVLLDATSLGILKVQMSGTYSPDIVIIADGAGHYLQLPKLTTTERDALTAVNGMVIYNSTNGIVESYESGVWGGMTPCAHVATHQNGGSDEASVTGLSGLLADDQHVLDAEVQAVSINNLVEDTTPQLGGHLDLNEKGIGYTLTLDTDEKWEGEYISGVYGDTLVFGDLIFLNTTDQRWEKAQADAEATSGDVLLGIALESGSDGDTKMILLHGFIRDDSWNFTSYGQAVFIDEDTAAAMNQTPPGTAGEIVRIVGYAGSNANVIYFDPSKTWLELA